MKKIYELLISFYKNLKTDIQFRKKFIKTLCVSILFLGILFYIGSEVQEANFLTQVKVQAFILQYGYFSWLIYIILLVGAIMSPIPDAPIVLAGGFIFSPYIAVPLTILGQLLGATIDFYLARKLGRNYVNKKFPSAVKALNEYSHKLGWQTVFLMRLTPTLSFDLLSYTAGLSSIRYKSYILATMCGMLPLSIITVFLGYSAGLNSKSIPIIILAVGSLVIMSMFLIFKKVSKR